MNALRHTIRRNPRLAAVLIALMLCVKAAMPAGFMVAPAAAAAAERTMVVTLCTAMPGTPHVVAIPAATDGERKAPAGKTGPVHCAYAALLTHAPPALPPAAPMHLTVRDAVPITGAVQHPQTSHQPYLRPPLRGPPAAT